MAIKLGNLEAESFHKNLDLLKAPPFLKQLMGVLLMMFLSGSMIK